MSNAEESLRAQLRDAQQSLSGQLRNQEQLTQAWEKAAREASAQANSMAQRLDCYQPHGRVWKQTKAEMRSDSVHLEEKYPEYEFALIMGEDNLKGLHKWKNYEQILENYSLYVYPRISEGTIESQFQDHPKIKHVDAPIMQLSATFIRKAIKEGKNIRPMLPPEAWQYLDEMNFYK